MDEYVAAFDECTGWGKCHGPLVWCKQCGSTNQTCDAEVGSCEQHLPCVYPGCTRRGYEGLCGLHQWYDPDGIARRVMES